MSIESEIFTTLKENAGLSALVNGRVYPMRLPQRATLPAVSYQRVSTMVYQTRDNNVGLDRPRFQFDAWADDFDDVVAMRPALIRALLSLHAESNLRVDATILTNDQDVIEPESGRYRAIIEAYIWHENEEN